MSGTSNKTVDCINWKLLWTYMLKIVNNYLADFSSDSPSIRRNKIYFAKRSYLMFSSSCVKIMTENPDISKNLVSQYFCL